MPTSHLRIALCTTIMLGATACGGKDEEFTPAPPFDNQEHVSTWATSASAVGVYQHVYKPIAIADGNQTFEDPECPVVEDDGTTWIATGGCTTTNSDGVETEWEGTVTIVRDGNDRSLTFDGFEGKHGSFDLREVETDRYEFDADFDVGGFTFIEYMGSVQGGYDQRTLWNGSGTVKRDGFIAPNGEVEASTIDEVVDNDVCAGQPVSGRTTLKSGEDTAVITYDGETDCDDEKKALLTVNDEDRGYVSDINCSVGAPAGGGRRGVLGALLLALAAPLARRGRQRNRSKLGAPHSSRRPHRY
jgi:MYXO-CTERM domain-containing protein